MGRCVTVHDFQVEDDDVGLAGSSQLPVWVCFSWALSHCSAETVIAWRLQGLFPVTELHGRRRTSVNHSCCFMGIEEEPPSKGPARLSEVL